MFNMFNGYQFEGSDNEAGQWFCVTCTAHYTPIVTGPFTFRSEAVEYQRCNRIDMGVFNPPPFDIVNGRGAAQEHARELVDEYSQCE